MDDNADSTWDDQERYVYDGEDLTMVYDETGTPTLEGRYFHGPGIDEVLAYWRPSASTLWTLTDRLGSVKDIVQTSGTTVSLVKHQRFNSFGQMTATFGSDPTLDFRYAFTGRIWDTAIDLQFNRARWYDPAVGRFISEDPIGFAAGDANLSRYVGNDPINFTDPSGLQYIPHYDIFYPAEGIGFYGNPPSGAPSGSEQVSHHLLPQRLPGSKTVDPLAAILDPSRMDFLNRSPLVNPYGFVVEPYKKYLYDTNRLSDLEDFERFERIMFGPAADRDNGEYTCIHYGVLPTPGPSGKAPKTAGQLAREANIAKGIPESQLGPSGKPKIHTVNHATKKLAKDAARRDGKKAPINHPSDAGQPPHYHATDINGNKIGGQSPHHNYPKSQR